MTLVIVVVVVTLVIVVVVETLSKVTLYCIGPHASLISGCGTVHMVKLSIPISLTVIMGVSGGPVGYNLRILSVWC